MEKQFLESKVSKNCEILVFYLKSFNVLLSLPRFRLTNSTHENMFYYE